MRLVKLNELEGYSDKELLPCVRGRIVKVHKAASGNGNYGPWHLQDIEIEGDGARKIVLLSGKEAMPTNYEGRMVEFSCNEGDKMTGVYAHFDQKKKVLKIKVTETGHIDFIENGGNGGAQSHQEPAQTRQTTQEPHPADREQRQPAQAPQTQQQAAPSTGGDRGTHPDRGTPSDVNEAKRQIMQAANLMLLCQICVETQLVPAFKRQTGKDMDEARKGAIASSLYISGDRKGTNTLMPTMPLFPAPAPAPEQEQAPQQNGGTKPW
jgi:hypothetical protein